MMTLLKVNLQALFSGIFMKSRSAKKRSPVIIVLIVLLAIYVVGAFLVMSGMMFNQLCRPLFSAGYGWLYFSLMGITVFALCFVSSLFAAQSQIFNAKDNELLLSLPIKPSNILITRIITLLLLDYLFEAFVVIPAAVIWCSSQAVNAVGFVFFLIACLILPLAALAFACFFAWIIASITSRLRNKNIITLVLSLFFLFAYFFVYSNISKYLQALIVNGAEVADAIRKAIFPAYHLGIAIESGNLISMIIFIICALAPFVIAVVILSANFIKIATTNRGAVKIKYTEKALKVSGVRTAFVIKELRHFVSNPMYMMNTALGGLFMVIGAVVLVVKRDMALDFVAQLNTTGLDLSPATLVCIALSAMASLNFVSAPSISLEGKNLWIAQSLPVKAFDVLLAKAGMHILVCGIPALVSSLICVLFLKATALQILLMLLVPFLFTVFTALVGVVINLQFPKFDWINEIQPIKQGASTMLSMFGSFALVAALAVLYVFLLGSFISAEIYILLCAVLFMILSAALYGYLGKGGSRRFEALNN